MGSFLEKLEWRNATKKFDPAKPVTNEQIQKITEAIRMAPSSFGLQPFYVKVVRNAATNEKLKAAGWGQVQFTTSTANLIFVARTDISQRIDSMLTQVTKGNAAARAAMKDYEGMMNTFESNLTPADKKVWAQKQSYIALGFALAACAELGVASCPMEGFVPTEFDKILNLI